MPDLIKLNKVSKLFGRKDNPTVALDDLTFSIEEKFPHTITVAGESGSGKTTLMMLILGFYAPTIGEVLFEGKDIWKLDKKEKVNFRRNVASDFPGPLRGLQPLL